MRKLNVVLALLVLIFAFSTQSCKKDSLIEPVIVEEREAPQLPAKETFLMGFEGFEEADFGQV